MPSTKVALSWPLVAILLAAMAILQLATVRHESQTADEGRQLLSGYSYLTSGHFTVAIEHPPLLKLLWLSRYGSSIPALLTDQTRGSPPSTFSTTIGFPPTRC